MIFERGVSSELDSDVFLLESEAKVLRAMGFVEVVVKALLEAIEADIGYYSYSSSRSAAVGESLGV